MLSLLSSRFDRQHIVPAIIFLLLIPGLGAIGPVIFEGEEAVSIYRDFDDGLFGRSLYRGVVFSVKLSSFNRYRSLPVRDMDGLTAYLLSPETAARLVRGEASGFTGAGIREGNESLGDEDPLKTNYRLNRNGMQVDFSLERVPDDMIEEIERTYAELPDVARQVTESYRSGYVIRVIMAENVYRPHVARIDYEDVLVAAALIGDDFQPLWGIHDGNNLIESD